MQYFGKLIFYVCIKPMQLNDSTYYQILAISKSKNTLTAANQKKYNRCINAEANLNEKIIKYLLR